MLPPIFIVGTGRSGTWILYKALGCHSAVHTFPKEMRFLIDPDGLFDLIDALTLRYHPVKASEALYRFERLMRIFLTTPDRTPYRGFDLPNWLGRDYYWNRLDQFCAELVELEYEGSTWQMEPEHEGRLVDYARRLQGLRRYTQREHFLPYRVTLPRNTLKTVKYFSNRRELTSLCATFVNDLFLHAARKHEKEVWCEKTPQHLLNLDVLWELFPQSVVIHIKRDPRGVVHSLTKKKWAPNDIEGASLWLRHVYDRWADLKNSLNLEQHCFVELKLEDLAASPRETMADVATICGLPNQFENLPAIHIERVNNWLEEMSQPEIQLANEILGPHIAWLGYE